MFLFSFFFFSYLTNNYVPELESIQVSILQGSKIFSCSLRFYVLPLSVDFNIPQKVCQMCIFNLNIVQQECIPMALMGVDVLCQAKSGMGKTAVFVLSVLNRIDKDADPISALILCHTRELAYQI